MSDHKHEQLILSKKELEQSLLPPREINYNDEKERAKIISDHAMQIAEDEELDIALGTLNIAWCSDPVITDSSTNKWIPSASKDLERVDRGIALLGSAKRKNSKLAIIALQESVNTPLLPDGKETREETIKRLRSQFSPTFGEKQTEIRTQIKRLEASSVWERANLQTNLPSWNVVTEINQGLPKTILFDKNILEEVEDANFNLDSLIDPGLTGRVQAIQLQKKGANGKPFMVYNVHFLHRDDPNVTIYWINRILNLEQNKGKTVYIMGDFNGRFPSTSPKFVNNGTAVVPKVVSFEGNRPHDCTDAIFKKTPTDKKPKRLNTQILHPLTAEAMPLPEVSREEAIGNSPQANYYFPVIDYADHQIACADDTTKTDRAFISEIEAARGISTTDQKAETEAKTETKIRELKDTPVFLEKNIFNEPRITINASLLNPAQIAAFKELELPLNEIDTEAKGCFGPAGVLIKRFSLYPRIDWHYRLLQANKLLQAIFSLDSTNLAVPLINKYRASRYLKRIAKIIGAVASLPAIVSAILFMASVGFVPAVFLAIIAGIVGITAGVMYSLGKYMYEHLNSPNAAPLVAGLFAAGMLFGISAIFIVSLAPSIAFAGIPFAPAVLAGVIGGLFMIAAAVVWKISTHSLFQATPDPAGDQHSSSLSDATNESKKPLLDQLQKSYGSTHTQGANEPTPSSQQKDAGLSALTRSTNALHESVRADKNKDKEPSIAGINLDVSPTLSADSRVG